MNFYYNKRASLFSLLHLLKPSFRKRRSQGKMPIGLERSPTAATKGKQKMSLSVAGAA